ncbi:MAG: phosphatidylglycerophosphatase, partial [uncultured bacterium]
MKKIIFLMLSTGFGLGYSPIAPGTMGSLPGFILVYLFTFIPPALQGIIIIALYAAGIYICNISLQWFKNEDPGEITFDEIVSIPITFFMIPLTVKTLIIGFILNRVLDIIKPPPAYQSQSLHKGLG